MKKTQYSISEHYIIYFLLIASAGMMGAYTFILRGNVFCNAQTANVVLMSIAMGQGQWIKGLYYLIPMSAYLFGALLSEILNINLKSTSYFKWSTYLVAIEILLLFGIGFIPVMEGTHHIVQVLINFIASMQFTAFRKAEGIPMATTFCTNHIRQMGVSIASAIHDKSPKPLKRGSIHFLMILFFFLGGMCLAFATKMIPEDFKRVSIWLCLLPLIIALVMLMYGDILSKRQRDAELAMVNTGIEEQSDSSVCELDNKVINETTPNTASNMSDEVTQDNSQSTDAINTNVDNK